MGCFPACFGQFSRNLTTKKVQHQCLSPSNEQHESVKLLPEKQESQKEEEQIIMPESEDKQKEKKKMDTNNEKNPFSDHSNLKKGVSEIPSSNIDEPVENENVEAEKPENERGVGDESGSNLSSRIQDSWHQEDFLINEKECAVEEESCSSLFSLSIDSRRQVFGAEMGGEREVSSLMKKTKNNASLINEEEEKENVAMITDSIIMEQKFEKSKPVETSLSTWLVESEKDTSGGSSSPESENNYGDRQILGVISSNADVKKVEPISNRSISVKA